jgi:hypothetical protein
MYMLRAISATLHGDKGAAVPDRARDLRLPEVAILAPLVAALIFLSFWPAGVTDHSFGGQPAGAVAENFGGAEAPATEEASP